MTKHLGLGQLEPEDQDTTILQNIEKYSYQRYRIIIAEDFNLQQQHCENLKSYTLKDSQVQLLHTTNPCFNIKVKKKPGDILDQVRAPN